MQTLEEIEQQFHNQMLAVERLKQENAPAEVAELLGASLEFGDLGTPVAAVALPPVIGASEATEVFLAPENTSL